MDTLSMGFGGGCHWCTEAVFTALRGVEKVSQGFIQSEEPHDTFSEAVIVEFRSDEIPLKALIEVHLRTHASTSNHKMRRKYRSAIYTRDAVQADLARQHLLDLQPNFDQPLVTQVLPFIAFRASDERFEQYFEKNAGGPFCTRYIDPKLDLLTAEFSELLKPVA